MNIISIIQLVVSLAKDAPEVVAAIQSVFRAIEAKQDPTPAILHLEIVAAARGLGLDPTRV